MLGEEVLRDLPCVSDAAIRRRFWLLLLCAAPALVAYLNQPLGRSVYFVAVSVFCCAQIGVIVAPRTLWAQFETKVVWEDVKDDRSAKWFLLVVSNLVTTVGFTICVIVLERRYSTGDLLSMSTVAEIGSTLFLVGKAQAAIGKPAIAFGRNRARHRQRAHEEDLQLRPPFSDAHSTIWAT